MKKKILFICDDVRMHSGISTISREIVLHTAHKYDYVIIGAAINHPQAGQRIDMSEAANKEMNITNANIVLYPSNGYGDPQLLRELIKQEKPDALMFITDPRFYIWLFQIENEVRNKIPMIYINIWDSLPYPTWNTPYYESCDLLFGISKQTVNINKVLLGDKSATKLIKYLPHGLNENLFRPLAKDDPKVKHFKEKTLGLKDQYDFIVLWNSRNIRRKSPGDVILSFKTFTDTLTPEEAKRCLLLMHCSAVDENGTDLNAVKEAVCDPSRVNIHITNRHFSPEEMVYLNNLADVNILISDNEGFGISLLEARLCAKMIIANVQGGMIDQMRFEDENGKWIEYDPAFPTNTFGKYKSCGEWAVPVFPSNISLVGSVPTPFIFNERPDFRDISKAIQTVYKLTPEERETRGQKGRAWTISDEAKMTSQHMATSLIDGVEELFLTWSPRSRVEILKVEDKKPFTHNYNTIYL